MKTKDISFFDRPWTRIKKKGVSNLSNAELLAAVIGSGFEEENAIDLSHRVISKYNFDKMNELTLPELKKEFKKEIHALKVQAMFEIFRRTNRLNKNGFKTKIKTAKDVYNYYIDNLQNKKKEHFYALLLDTKNQIISEELISVGTLNSSLIHPREVFNPAVKASANSIILIHNHPSGDSTPSSEDKKVTKMIYNAGDLLKIKVIDHIIIGSNSHSSLKELGIFNEL
jgi:DNA repair protein RadC